MDAHIKYGVDISNGGDVTVLTIKAGLQLHSFQGKDAEAILAWHEQEITKARISEINLLKAMADRTRQPWFVPYADLENRLAELSQTLKEHKEQ